MSAEAAVMAMLLANTALAAVVDDENIFPGQLDQERGYPALVVSHVSGVNGSLKVTEAVKEVLLTRVQVSVYADSYEALEQVLALVRNTCGNRRGSIGGVDVKNCRVSIEGPDLGPGDDGIWIRAQDLMVTWIRTLP